MLPHLLNVLDTCPHIVVCLAGGATPQHLLRPIFLHIQDQPNLHPQIFALLLPQSIDYSSPVFAKYSGNVTQELRHYFRESLARHLFGYDVLLQLRMRLYVAETLRVSLHRLLTGGYMESDTCYRDLRLTP